MTVKQILQQTATLSGREDVVEYLTSNIGATEDTLASVNVMVRLLNMVVSELSASFIPLITLEEIDESQKISYVDLSKRALEILNVYDKDGNELTFKVNYDCVQVQGVAKSIRYKYSPDSYGINDNVDYTEKEIPSAVLSYGLAAEFALSEGDFERACSMHDRYVEGVHALFKPKNYKTKERLWR